jgi:uncharacterized repeat protein (TIGR03803 family)
MALTSLYSFDGTNGLYPQAAVMQDTNGKFYGTTFGGGGNAPCLDGCGTIYEFSAGLGPFVAPVPTPGKDWIHRQNTVHEPGRRDQRDL